MCWRSSPIRTKMKDLSMKSALAAALVALCLISLPLRAQDSEYYFRFAVKGKTELDVLTRMISIENVRRDTVYAYATQKQWDAFRRLPYVIEELPYPGSLDEHRMSDAPNGILAWDQYPTYQGYLSMMREFAAAFPSICRLDTIGLSVQGRQILALKISDNVQLREDEPQFLYTSTMHGNETVGYVLLLRLADYLLTQYGQPTPEGERATNLVNTMEIWINPLFNPDGTYRNGHDTTVSGAVRGNAHGVDLNRDFPDRINDTINTTAGREMETGAMMRWTWKHNFTMSANFHCGVQVVNYPWDNGASSGSYSICPDDAWFIQASRAYATPNPDLMGGGWPNGITNGCAWYAIFGGRQDWMYWWNGGREVTIELSDAYNPPGSVLPLRWTNNKESFLAYMEEALKGVRGTIVDAATGVPLRARVDVIGFAGVPVYSDSAAGDYHRPLLPGTYALIARVAGFVTDTISNIVVTSSAATRVDFRLQPLPTTVVQHVDADWNLLSLPLAVNDPRPAAVYPAAISPAWVFDPASGYVETDTLRKVTGYWLKFAASQDLGITGIGRMRDTIEVQTGWNLIGAGSLPAPTGSIVEVPSGIVVPPYYRYSGSYSPADTLIPGRGYWAKVLDNGRIILR
jgi:hypothetical protein